MAYELLPTEQNEGKLLYRLDGETAERHGAIGYMRMDFGREGNSFWTTWFDNQRHLKTSDFKREFNDVVGGLRGDSADCVWNSRKAMVDFCLREHAQTTVLENGGVTFKIQTDAYSYYCRCTLRSGTDYDAYVFAYDNRYLLPELAGEHELPNDCFGILPSTGELIFIVYGEKGYYQLGISTPDTNTNRQIEVAKNALLGVTRRQAEAMLAGSVFGWDVPAAKPWNYEQDGTPRKPPKRNEPER